MTRPTPPAGIWRGTVRTVTGAQVTFTVPRLSAARVYAASYGGLTVGQTVLVGLVEGDPDQPIILPGQ